MSSLILTEVINRLQSSRDIIKSKRALIGFDGYVDELLKIVKSRENVNSYTAFKSMKEFGNYLAQNLGSCGLEIIESTVKVGGNGPIFANTLALLGIKSDCIGTFGIPKLHDVYISIPDNCNLISIGNPAHTLAFEFEDGKMMFGKHENLNKITWQSISQTVGIENMIRMLNESDLIGITNWSELIYSNDLWSGILSYCMPNMTINKERIIFFDIADPAKRSVEELLDALKMIERYGDYGRCVLGLNLKEAYTVYRVLYGKDGYTEDIYRIGKAIKAKLSIETLVIHSPKAVSAFTDADLYNVECLRIDNPVILTGCGDNFNAGLCMGMLINLSLDACLTAGVFTSSYYIEHGKAPNFDELIDYMKLKGGV